MTHVMKSDLDRLQEQSRTSKKKSLGELLERYRYYLELLARMQIGRQLRGKVDPGDIVQETFLRANEHFEQFRGTTERQFLNWLRKILGRVLANVIRGYRNQGRDVRLERQMCEELEQSSQVLGILAHPMTTPSKKAMKREEAAILAEALSELSEDYREVIVLRDLVGLPYEEIAEKMERSVDATRKLWARAIDKLRCALQPILGSKDP